ALFWYDLSATCHSKDSGPSQGLCLCRIILKYRCMRTELITPNLIYPSTHQLLRSSGGDFGPDMSFDKSASSERLFGFSPATLAGKSGFFLIDRWAIPDAMVWRHPDATIDDPRPASGSFSMADVRQLSAHVIKLRDMPEGVLVLYGLSRVWKSRVCDPAKAFQKRKASTFGVTSSYVAKRTRSALAQSSGSTTCPCLFVGNYDDESDGDDDTCVEIMLVTPLYFAVVIHSSGNQGRSSTAPAAEGPNTRDSRGKGIMANDAITPDSIHADFFPFFVGLYYAIYPQDGVAGNCKFTREDWDAPYRLLLGF
nr:hypothetical protein [Tanacetum cinerariifolium]